MSGEPVTNKPVVLVVDDYDDGRELAVDILAFAGFEVRQAANGLDALEMTRELLPDLLVLDLALPGLDGWQVAARLKAEQQTQKIPIIALTAHAEQSALDRAWAAGCDEVLTKPCPPEDLVHQVRRLVRVRATDRATRHG